MNARDTELLILRTLLKAQDRGAEWVKERITEIEESRPTTPSLWDTVGVGRWDNVATLGDALIKTITDAGKFISSRSIVDRLWDFPIVAAEADPRFRRRMVSQGLYVQKTKETVVSVKFGKSTLWGLVGWLNDLDMPMDQYKPDTSDVDEETD
ncbi:MAG: hypothetical protein JST66_07540 [Bacteroidetes bacterium]|nr:hypothetical protein [Bacteroidota bacterium]